MSMVAYISDEEHLTRILQDWDNVVICFSRPVGCVPCKRLEPHYNAIAEKMPEILFVKVDVDANPEIAERYQVLGVPSLMYYYNDVYVKHLAGRTVNQLYTEIKETYERKY